MGLRFGDEGARLLADELRTDELRATIHLDDNGITSEGSKVIFESLKSNTTLTSLTSISKRNSPLPLLF